MLGDERRRESHSPSRSVWKIVEFLLSTRTYTFHRSDSRHQINKSELARLSGKKISFFLLQLRREQEDQVLGISESEGRSHSSLISMPAGKIEDRECRILIISVCDSKQSA
ncbi:unnamed protein product [Ilex paraguariensis]|uniref:Uncharacterized protein n=1 Tax=Ilex paraguariensis TaxID=185542 RepID=A0ABC8TWD6_9AQUA